MWKLILEGGRVNLLVGEEKKQVKSLREGKHLMEIEVSTSKFGLTQSLVVKFALYGCLKKS